MELIDFRCSRFDILLLLSASDFVAVIIFMSKSFNTTDPTISTLRKILTFLEDTNCSKSFCGYIYDYGCSLESQCCSHFVLSHC